MENRFSVSQIRRRRRSTLAKFLARQLVHHSDHCAEKLQQYASQVLQPPTDRIATLQISLQHQVKLFNCLQESILHLNKEIRTTLPFISHFNLDRMNVCPLINGITPRNK